MALVIGNAAYADLPLRNPVNDALDLSARLRDMGFDVTTLTDRSRSEMTRAIRDFGLRAAGAEAAVFYFAGHGVQIRGRNYLLPVGQHFTTEAEVETDAVDVGAVLARIEEGGPRVSVLILDACRTNPLQRAGRSTGRGLARMDAPSGALIAFAAQPGAEAEDGAGRNGTFTGHLLRHIDTPGLPVEQLFKRVRADVERETARRQSPREENSLTVDFSFVPAPTPVVASPAQTAPLSPDPEVELWELAKRRDQIAAYLAYLRAYPEGRYAAVARAAIASLERLAPASTGQAEAGVGPAVGAVAGGTAVGSAPAADGATVTSASRLNELATAPSAASAMPPVPLVADITVKPEIPVTPTMPAVSPPSVSSAASVTLPAAPAPSRLPPELPRKPGEVFKDCAECPEMVVIPAGRFLMGSPAESEPRRSLDESPQRWVSIASFAMGKFEVTQAQWRAVMGTNPSRFTACDRTWFGTVVGTGDDCPVEQVSWYDAQEFVRRLRERTGRHYRLPSESEWEYAARAGGQSAYAWGDYVGSGNANCSSCGSRWDNKSPAPAGKFAANAFGLYDVHGNVLEWVQDVWHDNYAGAPSDGSAWMVGGDQSRRVLRGGSWIVTPQILRSANRFWNSPDLRVNFTGFRIARTF